MAEQTSIGIVGTGWVGASVALSLPAVVGSDRASVVLEPHLDQVERDGLVHSAGVLNEAIETVSGA